MMRKITEENYGEYSMLLLIAKYVLNSIGKLSMLKFKKETVIIAY